MSILTQFFNLIKPAKTDRYKVSDFNANFDTIDTEMHRPPLTVNGVVPDPETRNIALQTVPLADNLSSDDAIFNQGKYLVRTSGGGSPITDGAASLSTIKGNMVKTGYVAEEIDMTVNAVTRTAPPEITATLDTETFEAYVETAGTYTLTYTSSWSANPTLYGVTVTNTPISGDSIVIVWDGESEPTMTVNAVERPVPAPITATLDRDTFVAYVANSGTITLSYTSGWSANPALYGITVQNTPVSGDSIVVVYVKENRGTITPVDITMFNATGWNLYQASNGYAMVVRYSDTYGYKIGGSYSLVNFATTPTGTSTAIDVDANGYFNVPGTGYVIVTGGNSTTYVYPTWSDWTEGYEGTFQNYTVNSIDLSEIMVGFSAGLLAVGDVRDEINFNTQSATSRIQRLAYTAENLAAVIESGVLYDTDTNYIYAVRENPVVTAFSLEGAYTVSDHGLEFFTASTTTPPITETIYGDNLKDKLRTDVLTISEQSLSATQKAQVQLNLGVPSVETANRVAKITQVTGISSLATLKSALDSVLSGMADYDVYEFYWQTSTSFDQYINGTAYYCQMRKQSNTVASCIIYTAYKKQFILANRNSSDWTFTEINGRGKGTYELNFNEQFAGYITSDASNLHLFVPMTPNPTITSVTVNITKLTARGVDGYVANALTDFTGITISKGLRPDGFNVMFSKASGTWGTNNTPVVSQVEGTYTLA